MKYTFFVYNFHLRASGSPDLFITQNHFSAKTITLTIREAYNAWADQYDTNQNRTRDLEGAALRETLQNIPFKSCLEIGCGTGKNTVWLAQKAAHVTAVDLSEEMLVRAKAKVSDAHVAFKKADILQNWSFIEHAYDLVTFSLVLEHIEYLAPIFKKAADALQPGGYLYLGEVHPFKQYTGSKARFDTSEGQQVVTCYNHHLSDFVQAGKESNLTLVDVKEYFDENDRTTIPRIIVMMFRKT